ncbi:magnesium chelatase subunit H [Thermodesulfobacteriota bacterium]
MHITAIIGDFTYSKILSEVAAELNKRFKGRVTMTNHFCQRNQLYERNKLDVMEKDIASADFVFVCTVFDDAVTSLLRKHARPDRNYLILSSDTNGMKLTRIGRFCLGETIDSFADSKLVKVISVLKGLTGKSSPLEVRKLIEMADGLLKLFKFGKFKDIRAYICAWKYFYTGGKENVLNMFLFFLNQYYGFKIKYQDPAVVPASYIIHPRSKKLFTSVDEYLAWYDLPAWMPVNGSGKKKRPMVALLFYTHRYQNEDTRDLYAVIEHLENKGIGVLPTISNGPENLRTMQQYFVGNDQVHVDAVISFQLFRLEGGPLGGKYQEFEQLCQKMNIPFINYISMAYSTIEEWQERSEGLSPMETNIKIIFPELDGIIENVLIAGNQEFYDKNNNMIRVITPIEDRVEHAVSRTHKWLKLKYTDNKDKKIAFVLFNYPPGKENIGSAGNMDALESLIRVLDRMKDEGYTVSGYPRTRHELLRLITKKNVVNQSDWTSIAKVKENSVKVPVSQYQQWFEQLPDERRKEMNATWGDLPGEIMADEDNLYLPGLQFGNVFVGFQPIRGIAGDPTKTYHDSALPPHHQYLAFYRWLEETYQADAVVHFGTHGTLEFLPGKQVGLSGSCYPDILLGSLPNIYYYICSNPSEAMIAKRRVYATLVDHMTPPMIVSDLYGTFSEMETDIHNYFHLSDQSPQRAAELKTKILENAQQNNLVDIEAEDVDISQLYTALTEMKGSMMTKGVHVIGKPFLGDELVDYVLGIVRFDRGETVSLQSSLSQGYGISWDELRENPSRVLDGGAVAGILCDRINESARNLLEDVLIKKLAVKKAVKKHLKKKPGKEALNNLTNTLEFALRTAGSLQTNRELDSMIKAMNFEFIAPGLGGDPLRSPAVIPSGRNPYQFNPDLLPTDLACKRGATIARQVIESYKTEHDNTFPETVATILWGFETMKTQGETVGEIFCLIGVRPKRSSLNDLVGVEPIPLAELGRPRVDVAIEICGIFRDTFPLLMRQLDRAIRVVADLDEPDDMNFIKKHSGAIQKALEKEGIDKDKARHIAAARIFGPSESNYGTDVTDLIESSNWEEQSQIADLHLAKMSHMYGDTYHAEANVTAFREVLDTVDVVAQVRDNEEYGIADLDHYYEFLGGLSCTVEAVRKSKPTSGKSAKPVILVADSTKDKIKTANIKKTLDYEVRTKLLNPEWMKGQLESGYKGVKNMGERIEYLLGWQATSTGSVDNWVWSEMADKYMFNEDVRKQMMKENIWAVEDQLQRLMEAYQRDMWDASDEEIDRLKQIYLELEAEIEEQEE